MPDGMSRNALVHFPAGRQKVIAILDEPRVGEVVNSDFMSRSWIPERVKLQPGAHRGEQFLCEIWVTRVPA
jgi:hypothetical protein